MEDHRAHERITNLEQTMNLHMQSHATIELGIAENTRLTKSIEANTAELVTLIKGVKGVRGFVLWLAPFVAAVGVITVAAGAAWVWLKGHI